MGRYCAVVSQPKAVRFQGSIKVISALVQDNWQRTTLTSPWTPRKAIRKAIRHGIENHAPRLHRDRCRHDRLLPSRQRVDSELAVQADQDCLRLSCRRICGLVRAYLRRISLPEAQPAGDCRE